MVAEAAPSSSHIGLICPFPAIPQNCLNFYPCDPIRIRKQGGALFSTRPASILIGPQVTPVNIAMSRHHAIVSVAFHPGALYSLLGIPMSELFDEPFDGTLVLGNKLRTVNERLKETVGPVQMKEVVESFFLREMNLSGSMLPADRAMQELIRSDGLLTMDHVATLSCHSLRQFERKSKDMIGLSPKLFARLIRFSKAYRMKESSPRTSWTQIAHACGYYDQMFFIKDFKVFTGVTPRSMTGELILAPFRLQEDLPL